MDGLNQRGGSVVVSFRLLFQAGRMRVFLNATRLDPYHADEAAAWRRVVSAMRAEDHLVWVTCWHADETYFREAALFYADLPVPLSQIWVLGNTQAETAAAQAAGFRGVWVHHNAWLDERRFTPRPGARDFRAILVSQLAPYKRVHLAARVRGLALLTAPLFPAHQRQALEGFEEVQVLDKVPSGDVAAVLNRGQSGLMLSEEEGGCFASSEYLLCGLPVVSTPSRGGRDVFYTPENALLVEPTPEAVARGVDEVIARRADPWALHRGHVALSHRFRQRFINDVLERIRIETQPDLNPVRLFGAIFKHKMMDYHTEAEALAAVRAAT